MICCAARLAPLDVEEMLEITDYDELDLNRVGKEKMALFLVISDNRPTFNFLQAILQTQLFQILIHTADNTPDYHGELPVPVQIIADEFANIGKIPNIQVLIASFRSRRISFCPIIQNLGQLEAVYGKHANTIIDNCDTMLFLGGSSEKTTESISKRLGKTTVDYKNVSESRGRNAGASISNQILARDLLTPDEIARLPRNQCILFISGLKPFLSEKYDIRKHPRYKEISDENPNNRLDPDKIGDLRAMEFFDGVTDEIDLGNLTI